jgi:hypothetical protein
MLPPISITLQNVIFVPNLYANIFSVGRMIAANVDLMFSHADTSLLMDGEIIAKGIKVNSSYAYAAKPSPKLEGKSVAHPKRVSDDEHPPLSTRDAPTSEKDVEWKGEPVEVLRGVLERKEEEDVLQGEPGLEEIAEEILGEEEASVVEKGDVGMTRDVAGAMEESRSAADEEKEARRQPVEEIDDVKDDAVQDEGKVTSRETGTAEEHQGGGDERVRNENDSEGGNAPEHVSTHSPKDSSSVKHERKKKQTIRLTEASAMPHEATDLIEGKQSLPMPSMKDEPTHIFDITTAARNVETWRPAYHDEYETMAYIWNFIEWPPDTKLIDKRCNILVDQGDPTQHNKFQTMFIAQYYSQTIQHILTLIITTLIAILITLTPTTIYKQSSIKFPDESRCIKEVKDPTVISTKTQPIYKHLHILDKLGYVELEGECHEMRREYLVSCMSSIQSH